MTATPPSEAREPATVAAPATAAASPLPEIVPSRHVGRWVASALVLLVLAQFGHTLVTNPAWEWGVFAEFLFDPTILGALLVTLELAGIAAVAGFAAGVVLAAMRMSSNPLLQAVSAAYVWFFRAIPLIVQLLFWGNISYLYASISLGIPFGPAFFSQSTTDLIPVFAAAAIGLSLHEAAYAAEIVRGGILAVDPGQTQAADALGLPRLRRFRRIVLPQAMRTILPNAANSLITLLKATSVVYVLAIGELFYQVQVIYAGNTRVIPLLMVATAWYLALVTLLSVVQRFLERHYAKGSVR